MMSGHGTLKAIQIRQANGERAGIIDLRHKFNPVVADVLVGAALEGDTANDPILALLEVL